MCCNVLKYILFSYLASGSGDTTVRFWDVTTETPHHVCKGIFHLSMKAVFGIYNQTALISSAQLLLQAIKKHLCPGKFQEVFEYIVANIYCCEPVLKCFFMYIC